MLNPYCDPVSFWGWRAHPNNPIRRDAYVSTTIQQESYFVSVQNAMKFEAPFFGLCQNERLWTCVKIRAQESEHLHPSVSWFPTQLEPKFKRFYRRWILKNSKRFVNFHESRWESKIGLTISSFECIVVSQNPNFPNQQYSISEPKNWKIAAGTPDFSSPLDCYSSHHSTELVDDSGCSWPRNFMTFFLCWNLEKAVDTIWMHLVSFGYTPWN